MQFQDGGQLSALQGLHCRFCRYAKSSFYGYYYQYRFDVYLKYVKLGQS